MIVRSLSAGLLATFMLSGCVVYTQPENAPPPPSASPDPNAKWTRLGSVTANGKNDHDNLIVKDGGRYSQVQFRVAKGDIELHDLAIELGNGEKFSPPTGLTFHDGSRSSEINLPGGRRAIHRIGFRYTDKAGTHPVIEVFAR